jgi:hypothetical protein
VQGIDQRRDDQAAGFHFQDKDIPSMPLGFRFFSESEPDGFPSRHDDETASDLFSTRKLIPMCGQEWPNHIIHQSAREQRFGFRCG